MNGVIEKASNGLFENEVEFHGIYAKHLRSLKEDIGLFCTVREGYIISAIIGCLHSDYTWKDVDSSGADDKALSIMAGDLVKRKAELRYLYRLIMLWDEEDNLSNEEYMNRAFRDDSDDSRKDELKNNMKIFNSYAVIGIEYLYNKYKDCRDKNEICDKLNDFIDAYEVENGNSEDNGLPTFEPEFF